MLPAGVADCREIFATAGVGVALAACFLAAFRLAARLAASDFAPPNDGREPGGETVGGDVAPLSCRPEATRTGLSHCSPTDRVNGLRNENNVCTSARAAGTPAARGARRAALCGSVCIIVSVAVVPEIPQHVLGDETPKAPNQRFDSLLRPRMPST